MAIAVAALIIAGAALRAYPTAPAIDATSRLAAGRRASEIVSTLR